MTRIRSCHDQTRIISVGTQGPAGATGATGPAGDAGPAGTDGWSPVFAVVADGERRVLQVSDWTGGTGTKPATGKYVGATGLVDLITDGADISSNDVSQYANLAAFPVTGAAGTLYIAADTGLVYRWDGAAYVATGLQPIADQTILGNVSGSTATPTALTKTQVREFVGGKVQVVASPANGSTITLSADTGTLHITGPLVATLTIDLANLANGSEVAIWSQNGITAVTYTGGGFTYENGLDQLWAAGATKRARRNGTRVSIGTDIGPNLQQVYNVSAPNASVPVAGLRAVASFSNQDFLLGSIGTGAIVADIPDNTATGGNKRGTNAVDLQTVRSAATHVASGAESVLNGGRNSTASGAQSKGGGDGNTASGAQSGADCGTGNTASGPKSRVGGGEGNFATGSHSTIPGGRNCQATGTYGMSSGLRGLDVGVYAARAHGAGVVGDSRVWQIRDVQVIGITTDATPKALTADRGTASASNQLTLTNNASSMVTCFATARDDSGANNSAMWKAEFGASRGSGSLTILGTPTFTLIASEGTGNTWTIAATADTGNSAVRITATGEAGKTIHWKCRLASDELI